MNDKIFIISIELNSKAAVAQFEKVMNGCSSTYVKIMENTYAVRVSSSYTSEAIRDIVLNKMGGDCILFVMRSSIDAAWRIADTSDGWLKTYI